MLPGRAVVRPRRTKNGAPSCARMGRRPMCSQRDSSGRFLAHQAAMGLFAKGITRGVALAVALAFLVLVPPEVLARGPDLCVWKHLFHLSACPACGSTRALAAFFHGNLAQALTYNRNVVVTGPVLLVLLCLDVVRWVAKLLAR